MNKLFGEGSFISDFSFSNLLFEILLLFTPGNVSEGKIFSKAASGFSEYIGNGIKTFMIFNHPIIMRIAAKYFITAVRR